MGRIEDIEYTVRELRDRLGGGRIAGSVDCSGWAESWKGKVAGRGYMRWNSAGRRVDVGRSDSLDFFAEFVTMATMCMWGEGPGSRVVE